MAQTHNATHGEGSAAVDPISTFAAAAARLGYWVEGGLPVIGVFGPEGAGQMVFAPSDPAHVPNLTGLHNGQTETIVRSLMAAASAAVTPADLKEGKAQSVVDSVFAGTYKPKRNTNSDIVAYEVERRLRLRVSKARPDASPDQVENTAKAILAGDPKFAKLQATVDEIRKAVLSDRTFEPARKTSKNATNLADLDSL